MAIFRVSRNCLAFVPGQIHRGHARLYEIVRLFSLGFTNICERIHSPFAQQRSRVIREKQLGLRVARTGNRPERALVVAPEARYEENEDREDFESADHHEPDIEELAERGEVAVVLRGPDGA